MGTVSRKVWKPVMIKPLLSLLKRTLMFFFHDISEVLWMFLPLPNLKTVGIITIMKV